MTATFVSKLNGDDINHVYGCMLDPNGLECSYSVCNFETFMVGTDTYLTVHSVIDLSVQDPVANGNNENACGFVIVQVRTFYFLKTYNATPFVQCHLYLCCKYNQNTVLFVLICHTLLDWFVIFKIKIQKKLPFNITVSLRDD